jgi:predicted permease
MPWPLRILNIFRSNRISRDIAREMEFHIAEKVDDLVASGMTEAEARRAARLQFGNPTVQRERTRDMDIAEWVESVAGDARYAVRTLVHSPVFAVVTIASLGLGIGANATIFTLLDAVVLRPLAVDRPSELAYVSIGDSGATSTRSEASTYFTNPLWEQVRDRQDAFAALTAFGETSFDLADGGEARRVSGKYVSGDFFRTFGVAPAAGRLFNRSDDVRGCTGTAVLSYRFWEREYGAAPGAVGTVIRLSGHLFEIAGITESSFRGPNVGRESDVYLPICAQAVIRGPNHNLDARSNWWMRVIGRVGPGLTLPQAAARIAVIARPSFEETIPPQWRTSDYVNRTLLVAPAEHGFSDVRNRYRTALFALMAGVAFILLIACANVANLLLSRAEARHREMAIRLAIGAGRRRLLRQLLTESVVLAMAGAAVGLLVARAGTRALVALITTAGDGAVSLDLSLNPRLLSFMITIATTTVILCGLFPAWRATRVSEQSAMKAQSRGVIEGHTRFRLGKSLVVLQVALSLVLIVSAGFLMGTLRNLSRTDLGFEAGGVMLAYVDLGSTSTSPEAVRATHRMILQRVRALPGVLDAGSADLAPVGSATWNDEIIIDGLSPRSFEESISWFNEVSDGYFATMKTRLLAGRDFGPGDVPSTTGRVAIVNDAFGRRFFGNDSPVGRQFRLRAGDTLTSPITIVGLVENAKYRSLREEVQPIAYLASSQNVAPDRRRFVAARAQANLSSVVPGLRSVLQGINPAISVEFRALSGQIADSLQRERMLATLSGVFGAVALALAVLGLYGVTSYSVARRRAELGVRIALGAVRSRVVKLVLGEVAVVVTIGLVIGAAGARLASTQVAPFLYGTEPADPRVYVMAALVLAAVAFVAGLIPAWRAARVDPIEALREQ